MQIITHLYLKDNSAFERAGAGAGPHLQFCDFCPPNIHWVSTKFPEVANTKSQKKLVVRIWEPNQH